MGRISYRIGTWKVWILDLSRVVNISMVHGIDFYLFLCCWCFTIIMARIAVLFWTSSSCPSPLLKFSCLCLRALGHRPLCAVLGQVYGHPGEKWSAQFWQTETTGSAEPHTGWTSGTVFERGRGHYF